MTKTCNMTGMDAKSRASCNNKFVTGQFFWTVCCIELFVLYCIVYCIALCIVLHRVLYSIVCCIASWSPRAHLARGGDAAVYVFDLNQRSLSTPFYSVLVSISSCMALLTAFHSLNSPNNSPISRSVLPVLFLRHWSFQLYISLWKSPSAVIYSLVVDWT